MSETRVTGEAGTRAFAAVVAKHLRPGLCIGLVGDLGAGKTVFVRGLVEALKGNPEQVRSPTFTLLNLYGCRLADAPLTLNHFDLYRLSSFADLESTGFFEFARGDGVTLVEWSDRVPELDHELDACITFRFGATQDERVLVVSGALSFLSSGEG